MSCYHPLRAFWTGEYTANGKKEYIVGDNVDHIEFYNGSWHKVFSQEIFKSTPIREYIEVPCGHCIGCKLDYAKTWADRCVMELDYHQDNYYLTFTYDDDHLPTVTYEDEDGVYHGPFPTLHYRDMTLFIKRLRKNLKLEDFRYFYCGEYGEDTERPHYHMIAYGLPISDLQFLKQNKHGDPLYFSETLSKIWDKGFVTIGEVNWKSCRYVAGYVQKKAMDPTEAYRLYDLTGRVRPRTRMSTKPAIGRRFYEDHKEELYKLDHITIKGIEIRPSRYFDKLLDSEDPDLLASIKERKVSIAKDRQEIILSNTSLDLEDQRKVEERKKLRQVRQLKRDL